MTAASRPRLLIVDDETAQMQALCDTLTDDGYETLGVGSGEAALAALRRATFDLLLADLNMPGMNGIALLRAAFEIDPMLVAVIMTGEGTIGTAVEAMQSGALDYILKPFRLGAIRPVLSRGLAMRRLRVENAELQRRLREHAAELEAANHELDAFTRSASHDLRSPLNAIHGFASLLLTGADERLSGEQREWLHHIERSAMRMNQLIDDLMRLSRLGRQALDLQPVDVAALVSEVVAELKRQYRQQHRHEPQVQVGELPPVQADLALLRQVFVNLLSNAFKFTRLAEPALIRVGVEQHGDERCFFVKDNGPGFDMKRAAKLFTAFERLHSAEEYEGSGVGLSIVQRIVQRHGGRIWAEAAPGQGATFFFTLGQAG